MKTLTHLLCSAICFSIPLFAGTALASSSQSQGGVIHFVGAIVEDPCNIGTTSRDLSMSCYRDGKVNTSTISYQQAAWGKKVNTEAATVSMRYLNPQKTLGIVTINYR